MNTIRSRSPQIRSSGQSIRSSSKGSLELREQAASGVEHAHALGEAREVPGERLDDLGIGGAGIAEREGAVDAADDRLDDPVGHRDRRDLQEPDQPLALDRREPAGHVEAGRRDRDDPGDRQLLALGGPEGERASQRVADHVHLAPVGRAELGDGGVDHRVPLREQQLAQVEGIGGSEPAEVEGGRRPARLGEALAASPARCRRCRRSRAGAAAGDPRRATERVRVATPASRSRCSIRAVADRVGVIRTDF